MLERVAAIVLGAAFIAASCCSSQAQVDYRRGTQRAGGALVESERKYSLIPLDAGNFSEGIPGGLSVDASGDTIVIGGPSNGIVRLLRPPRGLAAEFAVPMPATLGQQLSGDGRRFFFRGRFRDLSPSGRIGYLDVENGNITAGPGTESERFTVDHVGHRIAFMAVSSSSTGMHYFLYDQATDIVTQLTTTSGTIDVGHRCIDRSATTPLIASDGNSIVVISAAELDGTPESDEERCHVFRFDIASRQWDYILTLPAGLVASAPSLGGVSAQFLSLTGTRSLPNGGVRSLPVLIDLHSGAVLDPIPGTQDFAGFDSVVSGHGAVVIISSRGDLDPSVGNPDGNMELFAYDPGSSSFAQITDTTGGIGQTPGGCPRYNPRVSKDGTVVLFEFHLYSSDTCRLDGPQRNRLDGFGFGRVRAIRVRPGNREAVLEGPIIVRALAGAIIQSPYTAEDADTDPITYFAQTYAGLDVPPGAVMIDQGDGEASLEWLTTTESVGAYRIRVAAFDEGGGETFMDTAIGICEKIWPGRSREQATSIVFAPRVSPHLCHEADINGDNAVTAADLVAASVPSVQ